MKVSVIDVTYAHRDEPRYLPFIMKSFGNATASREETTLLIAETVTHNKGRICAG